jgi:hypothetical protein
VPELKVIRETLGTTDHLVSQEYIARVTQKMADDAAVTAAAAATLCVNVLLP